MTSARKKPRADRLFSAAVLRRSAELASPEHGAGFAFVYQGVLRDLGVTDEDVRDYLDAHGAEVDAAVGRGRGAA